MFEASDTLLGGLDSVAFNPISPHDEPVENAMEGSIALIETHGSIPCDEWTARGIIAEIEWHGAEIVTESLGRSMAVLGSGNVDPEALESLIRHAGSVGALLFGWGLPVPVNDQNALRIAV